MEEGDLAASVPSGVAASAEPLDATMPDQAELIYRRSQVDSKRHAKILELMKLHGERIFGFCMRMVRDEATASDVLQQTFVEAFRDLEQFEERASMQTWLTGIARHRCLDAIKRDHRLRSRIESNEQAMLEHTDPGVGPGERLDRARLNAALEDCLRQLPLEMRATVLARFMTGFTYAELAGSMDATANTLQVRVARALRNLRLCLEKRGWSYE
ncbi:MAG TPA: sigma-70 family RNA polymerase sigma factor [Kofleriaceae bacterium]|nr:sigma-70 family RNA polymerase sigma factor [Kofleriaceae bacterium]